MKHVLRDESSAPLYRATCRGAVNGNRNDEDAKSPSWRPECLWGFVVASALQGWSDPRQRAQVRLHELRLRLWVHPPLRRVEQPQDVAGHELRVAVAEGFAAGRRDGRRVRRV